MGVGPARTWLPPILVAAAVLLLANLPRLSLYVIGPPGHAFLGPVWGSWDAMVYYELVGDGAAGSWLWTDRLDGPPHGTYFLYPPYLFFGRLLAPLGLWPPAVYELLRWLWEPLGLAAAWLYVRASLPPPLRVWGYAAGLMAGGAGFLFLARPSTPLGQVVPIDVTDPTFSVLNGFQMAPHLALAAGGLAVWFWGLLAASEGRRRGLWGAAGLALVCSFHAFVAPMALLAGGVFWLWHGRRGMVLATLVAGALVAGPIDLYWLHLKATDRVLFASQLGSPAWEFVNPASLLVARLLLLAPAVTGAWRALKDREPALTLALIWAVLALAFNWFPAFASTPLHRTLEGSSLAWGVLAGSGLVGLARRWRVYLLAAASLAPFVQAAAVVVAGRADPSLYLGRDQVRTVAWARAHDLGGRALASPASERLFVSLTDLYSDRATVPNDPRWLTDGLVAQPPDARSAWLRARGDTVVYWGAAEQSRYGRGALPGLAILHREGDLYLLGPEG